MRREVLKCFLSFIVKDDGKFCVPEEEAAWWEVKWTRVWGWIKRWGLEGWAVAFCGSAE